VKSAFVRSLLNRIFRDPLTNGAGPYREIAPDEST
jgi:hypothetical protein